MQRFAGLTTSLSIEALIKMAKQAKKETLLSSLNHLIEANSLALGDKLAALKPPSKEVKSLVHLYRNSFVEKFIDRTEVTPLLVKSNSRNLSQLQARHSGVVDALTEVMTTQSFDQGDALPFHAEDILQEQICLGLLIQHAAQLADLKTPSEFGVVRIDESMEELCSFARMQAIALANHNMTVSCPPIEMRGLDKNPKLTCVPSVVEFAILECLKNAVYSSIKKVESGNNKDQAPPSVVISVIDTKTHLVVEILDEGIGMDCSTCESALRFDLSSARSTRGLVDDNRSYQPMSAPLQGFGVGCVLAKLHLLAVNAGSIHLTSPGPGLGAAAVLRLRKPTVEP